MFYFRLNVLLLPVFLFASAQLLLFFPKNFLPLLIIGSGLLVFWIFKLFKTVGNKKNLDWLNYSVLPLFFHLSAVLYFSIEPNLIIGQLILFLDAFFQFHYLKNIYYFVANKENRNEQLKNISFFGGVLVIFFSAGFIYGLKAFLGYSLLPIFFAFSLAIFASWYQIFIFGPFSVKKNINFFLIALLSLLQIALVLFFLPFSYHILGIIMTLAFYFVVGLGRLYLQGFIPKKQLKFYLLFTILAGFFLLLTARWL